MRNEKPPVMSNFTNRLTRRLVIHPKDIEELIGLSARGARQFILTMKKKLGKAREQFIYVHELSEYLQIEEQKIRELLRLPLLYLAYILLQLYFFIDDFDVWLMLAVTVFCISAEFPIVQYLLSRWRLFLLGAWSKTR